MKIQHILVHPNPFDLSEGERLKSEGMRLAKIRRRERWAECRDIALWLGRFGDVTADDVQREYMRRNKTLPELGNAAGSLFPAKHWAFTGMWRKSRRKTNHARVIRVWRLKAQ